MSQVRRGVRSVLQVPFVFDLFKSLTGARQARQKFVTTYARPRPGERILDIGCGTGELVDQLPPQTEYVGFDFSKEYVRAASQRYGGRGRFLHAGVGDATLSNEGPFDLAIAFGVLHHLDDAMAGRLFEQAHSLLRPGGRLITYDGCWMEGQSRIARWLLSKDRGKAIRTVEQLTNMARVHFGDVSAHVRHDLLWIPYTHVVLQCRLETPPAISAST